QVLLAQRLGQEFDRTGLHGAHAHRDVAVSRDEDDRNADIVPDQLSLKIEAAQTRKPDVEDKTAGHVRTLALEKLCGRIEQLHMQADRAQKAAERLAQ